MNQTELRALHQLARLEGVHLSYTSTEGHPCQASPEALFGVLKALGLPVKTDKRLADIARDVHRRRWLVPLPPVIVAWNSQPIHVVIRLPAGVSLARGRMTLVLEEGQKQAVGLGGGGPTQTGSARLDGVEYLEWKVALPSTPLGYHRLELEMPKRSVESLLISAPSRSYSAPLRKKRWGVFLPMYALVSRPGWGAGDFGDWRRMSEWASSLGAEMVASLPLLAAFLGKPVADPSPYSPVSRLFWNEFYLEIESVPEFIQSQQAQRLARSAEFQRKLNAFRRDPAVDYLRQMAARRQVLEHMASELASGMGPRRSAFQDFLRRKPEVEDYARFRAVGERRNSSWPSWPEPQKSGHLRAADFDKAVVQYHAYVQWLAQEQIAALVGDCRQRGLRLYLDMPLGVHPDGYDAWRERDAFALGASVGAPPDSFFSKGQDWGFAPLHPQQIRRQGYRYVLSYLRFQMRQTGLLRIDHVMGLHRLYWIPRGLGARDGAYVSYPAHEYYALLCLESHRHQTTLVGENLGTVPPEVNASMKRHGLRQIYVLQFEQTADPRTPVRPPPRLSVASLNTHDTPTFAAHWKGKDLSLRMKLDLIGRRDAARERQERSKRNSALVRFLRKEGHLNTLTPTLREVVRGCLLWLSRSSAEMVLINLEDLWAEESPQNVPGTCQECPNWRRKAQRTLEEIEQDPDIRALFQEINAARQGR